MCPLPFLAGVIVPDEALANGFVKDIIDNGVLDYLVHKRRGLYRPFLWLVDLEDFKLAGPIAAGQEQSG